jgi:hypothetical protein
LICPGWARKGYTDTLAFIGIYVLGEPLHRSTRGQMINMYSKMRCSHVKWAYATNTIPSTTCSNSVSRCSCELHVITSNICSTYKDASSPQPTSSYERCPRRRVIGAPPNAQQPEHHVINSAQHNKRCPALGLDSQREVTPPYLPCRNCRNAHNANTTAAHPIPLTT